MSSHDDRPPPPRPASPGWRPAGRRPPAPKLVDGFAKQLIALAPGFWASWVTQQSDLEPATPLDPEFRLVFRQTDSLLPVTMGDGQRFLILFEFQFAHDPEMPRRVNAYASLAEERYRLPVFPVLVCFQPPPAGTILPTRYEASWLGLGVTREYRVINLWEVPAARAFEPDAAALLVLLPFLAGGEQVPLLERALTELRQRAHPPDLELFLLYLIQRVGGDAALHQLGIRLDRAMLRQTTWFDEIIQEGREEGRQEGLEEGLRRAIRQILVQRFGRVPAAIEAALVACPSERLEALTTLALTTATLEAFAAHLDTPGA